MGLARAWHRIGKKIGAIKVGPDYIDPAFLSIAGRTTCRNLDPWAMRSRTINQIYNFTSLNSDILLVEGVMGLFDGASDGTSSTADFASQFNLPILMVVDCTGVGASIGAILHGFSSYKENIKLSGVILNQVGSKRHENIIRRELSSLKIPILGVIPKNKEILLKSRYLGLVQAGEHTALNEIIDKAADLVEAHIDISKIEDIMNSNPSDCPEVSSSKMSGISPLSNRIAIAYDSAFSFVYPTLIESWYQAGACIDFFSPLEDESPNSDAGAIYLPGGYPELHAGKISTNTKFLNGLKNSAKRGTIIYGECGGYMTLGKQIVDEAGIVHEMANIFPLETNFARKKLALGYREAKVTQDGPLGKSGTTYRGHEFHYSNEILLKNVEPLFDIIDASGSPLGNTGIRIGNIMGSFVHLIDMHNNIQP